MKNFAFFAPLREKIEYMPELDPVCGEFAWAYAMHSGGLPGGLGGAVRPGAVSLGLRGVGRADGRRFGEPVRFARFCKPFEVGDAIVGVSRLP